MGIKVRLTNVRVAFADGLYTAKAFEEGQTPKFGSDFLLVPGHAVHKADVGEDGSTKWVPTKMSEVLLAVADETWKGKGKVMLESLEVSKKCLRNGDLRLTKAGDRYEGYQGIYYVTAKNKIRPQLLDQARNPVSESDGKIYSGCYVNAVIEVFGIADPKRKGVHAQLKGVQFAKPGDAFGGGAPASKDDFEDLGVEEDIPF